MRTQKLFALLLVVSGGLFVTFTLLSARQLPKGHDILNRQKPLETDGSNSDPVTVPELSPPVDLVNENEGNNVPVEQEHDDGKVSGSQYTSLTDHIWKTVPKEQWGPSIPTSHQSLKDDIGCDMFTVPFDTNMDAGCLAYMSDFSNWDTLKPIAQAFDERTIKFKVTFKDARLHGVVKVPQRLYPFEPYSEVASFHADRVLSIKRIPPVTLTHVPLSYVLEAVDKFGKTLKLVEQFAHDSQASNYSDWIQKDLVSFVRGQGRRASLMPAVHVTQIDGVEHVAVSVQLFMADANHLLDTSFAIPYRAHDPSWHKYFDPEATPVIAADLLIPLTHISQLCTFDFVLGNNDRSPNKNNFVVGGCKRKRCQQKGTPIFHPGPPDFVYLDQGLCFHHAEDNPLSKRPESTFCVFYEPLVNRLRQFDEQSQAGKASFSTVLGTALPKSVHSVIGEPRIRACDQRISQVVKQLDHCLLKWPRSHVLVT